MSKSDPNIFHSIKRPSIKLAEQFKKVRGINGSFNYLKYKDSNGNELYIEKANYQLGAIGDLTRSAHYNVIKQKTSRYFLENGGRFENHY